MVKRAPPPGLSSTRICPPSTRTCSATSDNPRPLPLPAWCRASRPRQKRSKMCARSSSAMPLPLSLTAMETVSVEDWTLMPVAPPAYRSAFFEQVAHDPLHPPTINTGMDGVRSVGGDRRPLGRGRARSGTRSDLVLRGRAARPRNRSARFEQVQDEALEVGHLSRQHLDRLARTSGNSDERCLTSSTLALSTVRGVRSSWLTLDANRCSRSIRVCRASTISLNELTNGSRSPSPRESNPPAGGRPQ